ncbi:hypothetical protein HDV00_011233 [Rhizophlyctis rosea]|nr:hypothetical protein HDV00_011233 [Rhizophlyctis rosea]
MAKHGLWGACSMCLDMGLVDFNDEKDGGAFFYEVCKAGQWDLAARLTRSGCVGRRSLAGAQRDWLKGLSCLTAALLGWHWDFAMSLLAVDRIWEEGWEEAWDALWTQLFGRTGYDKDARSKIDFIQMGSFLFAHPPKHLRPADLSRRAYDSIWAVLTKEASATTAKALSKTFDPPVLDYCCEHFLTQYFDWALRRPRRPQNDHHRDWNEFEAAQSNPFKKDNQPELRLEMWYLLSPGNFVKDQDVMALAFNELRTASDSTVVGRSLKKVLQNNYPHHGEVLATWLAFFPLLNEKLDGWFPDEATAFLQDEMAKHQSEIFVSLLVEIISRRDSDRFKRIFRSQDIIWKRFRSITCSPALLRALCSASRDMAFLKVIGDEERDGRWQHPERFWDPTFDAFFEVVLAVGMSQEAAAMVGGSGWPSGVQDKFEDAKWCLIEHFAPDPSWWRSVPADVLVGLLDNLAEFWEKIRPFVQGDEKPTREAGKEFLQKAFYNTDGLDDSVAKAIGRLESVCNNWEIPAPILGNFTASRSPMVGENEAGGAAGSSKDFIVYGEEISRGPASASGPVTPGQPFGTTTSLPMFNSDFFKLPPATGGPFGSTNPYTAPTSAPNFSPSFSNSPTSTGASSTFTFNFGTLAPPSTVNYATPTSAATFHFGAPTADAAMSESSFHSAPSASTSTPTSGSVFIFGSATSGQERKGTPPSEVNAR